MADEILSQAEIEALIAQASGGAAPEATDAAAAPVEAAPAEVVIAAAAPAPPPPSKVTRIQPELNVRTVEFSPVGFAADPGVRNNVDLILDVHLQVAVELGRTKMQVREVLGLGPGSVVELDKHAGEPVEVVVNNKIIARGEVVVIDENFGVRITEIVNSKDKDAEIRAAA